jgi:hemoglobin-like flavoprotein
MTPKQIELVQNSWQHVVTNVSEAGEIFYARLFDKNPQLRSMFSTDIREQSRKLIGIITFAVKKLNNLSEVISDVQALGRRHGKYGVQPSHYVIVADSLLWTLEKGLGDQWNDETKDAWTKLYTTLAEIMINAAKEEPSVQREIVL